MESRYLCISLVLLLGFIPLSQSHSCTPEMIHIAISDAYTTNPDSQSPIKVIFQTEDECSDAYIKLELTASTYINVSATNVNYFFAEYSEGDYSTYIHIFDFPSLPTEEVYSYLAYSDSQDLSPEGPFEFYVPTNQPKNAGKIVLFGDLDHTTNGMDTFALLSSIHQNNFTEVAAYVHMGDIAYNLEDKAGEHGDEFMNAIQDFAASIPYMVSPGNHEVLYNFSNFNMRFKMPFFQYTQNHYYSYNLGLIHFTTLDFDLIINYPDLTQYMANWLQQDLAQANQNRENVPWLVIYTHRPLYCTKKKDPDCENNAQLFAIFEDIIYQNKVDMYLSGHVHAYERMYPIYQGQIASFNTTDNDLEYHYMSNASAPVYILQGMAGHHHDDNQNEPFKPEELGIFVTGEYSVVVLEAKNSSTLKLEMFYSATGELGDYVYLSK